MEQVNHPEHYGGENNTYEAIKVIEAWSLNFNLGNCIKYIARNGKKSVDKIEDLKKARWYLDREINNILKETEDKEQIERFKKNIGIDFVDHEASIHIHNPLVAVNKIE